ncbi:hypothetical protein [uncultured Pseudoalteromonas sp.]|uniref:hypothetical protein n=1 Tax=uncultured Pseudoalteromonas sp. TaxID=114053 RepID=UPI0025922741|nr:hypothetical protein [uncultured Pseudoalteromonas sp.]
MSDEIEAQEDVSLELGKKIEALFAEYAADKKMTLEHMGAMALYVATHLNDEGERREGSYLIPQIKEVEALKNSADIAAIIAYYILSYKKAWCGYPDRSKHTRLRAQQIAALLEKSIS